MAKKAMQASGDRGALIAIEGISDRVISDQAVRLCRNLNRKEGIQATREGEPTGGPVGRLLKKGGFLTGEIKVPALPMQNLFIIDRVMHLTHINEMLADGVTVVAARWDGSTFVYGLMKGAGKDQLKQLHEMYKIPHADLTVLVTTPPDEALRLTEKSSRTIFDTKWMLRRATQLYEEMAKREPGWVVVDGKKNAKEIAEEIRRYVKGYLASPRAYKNRYG